MLSIFLSLFLGSVLITAGDTPNQQDAPAKTSEAAAAETEPSGVATVVEIKGQAKAVSKSTGGERVLKEGDALYLDETISTGASSSMQLEIADESLFTLSENTVIRMDLFDLDEKNKDGHLKANVSKGIFRFASGKVTKLKPENVSIEMPVAVLAIRGTVVLGEVDGEKCLISLEAEEGSKDKHRIVVSNKSGDKTQEVEITTPGFATMIEGPQGAPKPAFELPKENRERFQRNLPTPKYLPRDAQGRPAMNPNVRDPQKYPGPMKKQDDQKNPNGPKPPGGPGGEGREKENLNGQNQNGSDITGRDRKQYQEFDENSQGEKQGIREPEKSAYEKEGYQLPFEAKAGGLDRDESKPSSRGEIFPKNSGAENYSGQRPGEFGNFKSDFGNRGPQQQTPGSFQQGSSRGPQQGQRPADQGQRPGGGSSAQSNGPRAGGPKR